ncbi:MAG: transcription elongation factor GreA [Spirochaetia bacterium]|nr:transcription elongation factor GreA [Spirochaetia bacterium]
MAQSEEETKEETNAKSAENKETANASIAEKIQNQFNEEKWTRISAKNVSISRFRLLEDLLQKAGEENFLEKMKELSKEHLIEYDASIAARYFLGMIALKKSSPDELIYLKQLLDQFQDIAKWAVVDYLSDKMLQVSENRTILRAKANALEKLGKTKEAIPVLEKLARIDRKNPDIALKYADAIINSDLDKGILFYKQATEAYAKNLQFEKLKNVWNKLIDLIPDDFLFFRKIERILSGHRQKEILADLYVKLTHHYLKKEDVENTIILCKKILEYNPNYVRFKNELLKAYREKYKDHSLLEDFIKYSGLLNVKRNILSSIQNFETNIVFDKDNYVYHRSWGVGKIIDLNTKEMTIDFKNKQGHKMEIQMALKSLKPLKEDHFLVHQYENPEKLKKLFDEDIIAFFKLLISSFGNKISLTAIKQELIDKYVQLKDWSKFWSKVRQEILKDKLIGISSQKKDIVELYEAPITFSESAIDKFQAAQNFDERVQVAVSTMKSKDTSEIIDALEYMQPFFIEGLKSPENDVRLQSIWTLDLMKNSLHDEEPLYDKQTLDNISSIIKQQTKNEVSILSLHIKELEIKKQYAKWLKQYHPDWKNLYIKMLVQLPIKIHKNLINELIIAEAWQELNEFIAIIKKDTNNSAEIFLWVFKQIITGAIEIKNIEMEDLILSFFRIARNIPKLEQKGTKLRNAAREIYFGTLKDDFEKNIVKYAKNSVRKMASLIKDAGLFSEPEREMIIKTLHEMHPDEFKEDIAEKKEASGESFIEKLEKSGESVGTQNALESMKKELEHLLKVEIPENSEEIGIAQEKGDLRENAEYKAALERQSILQATVTKLEGQIKKVILLKASNVSLDTVTVGSKVRLKDQNTQDIFVYSILDQWDADVDKGIISYKSPLGQAIIGRKKGEIVTFGKGSQEQKLEIISMQKTVNEDGYLI